MGRGSNRKRRNAKRHAKEGKPSSGVKRVVRDAVLERDNHCCQVCGTEGSKKNPLTMHHIKYRRDGGKYAVDNLTTFCQKCHKEFHIQNG